MAQEGSSVKFQDQIASALLRTKKYRVGEPVTLCTNTGRPLPILIHPHNVVTKQKPLFSTEDMLKIQSSLNLSTSKTLKMCTQLRRAVNTPRSVIAPNLKWQLLSKNHELDEFFAQTTANFCIKGSQNAARSVVYCGNIEAILSLIVNRREFSPYYHTKIGIDGGGGFLKVCVNIIDKIERHKNNNDINDSGVKKLIILGIVCDVEENYNNVSILWNLMKLDIFIKDNDNVTIACDLKMANILAGLMSHASAHPCTWCCAKREHLGRPGLSRTLTDNEENYNRWLREGGDSKKAKFFFNCINVPLIKSRYGNEDILEIIPPPELHLMLGVVNYLYTKMCKDFPKTCEKWTKFCAVEREAFHGGSFNGNSCRRLLSTIDYLRSICPIGCLQFVKCFASFEKVIVSCFGKQLSEKYLGVIETFKNDFLGLNIRITPKLHAIFCHVPEYCARQNQGLGFVCEQASEAVHSDFGTFWNYYKVSTNNVRFGERFFRAVVNYNSSHI